MTLYMVVYISRIVDYIYWDLKKFKHMDLLELLISCVLLIHSVLYILTTYMVYGHIWNEIYLESISLMLNCTVLYKQLESLVEITNELIISGNQYMCMYIVGHLIHHNITNKWHKFGITNWYSKPHATISCVTSVVSCEITKCITLLFTITQLNYVLCQKVNNMKQHELGTWSCILMSTWSNNLYLVIYIVPINLVKEYDHRPLLIWLV